MRPQASRYAAMRSPKTNTLTGCVANAKFLAPFGAGNIHSHAHKTAGSDKNNSACACLVLAICNTTVLAAFVAKIAELERKRIRTRINAGLERARVEGKVLGRPRFVIDRARVWALKDSGRSTREISEALGLSQGTVQRAIQART
jgi:hypothetical protein